MAMSQIVILYILIRKKTFVTEVSLIQTLIKEKPVIKYVILLGKDNRNRKKCLKPRKTWVKVYTRYLILL